MQWKHYGVDSTGSCDKTVKVKKKLFGYSLEKAGPNVHSKKDEKSSWGLPEGAVFIFKEVASSSPRPLDSEAQELCN